MNAPRLQLAIQNVRDTVTIAMSHTAERGPLILFDASSELAQTLIQAYAECLPNAQHVPFYDIDPEAVKATFEPLVAGDLVVLIQSSSFHLADFRIRVELYRRDIKVIEHANLSRMKDNELDHYVASLAYDAAYYRGIGHALKARIDTASSALVESGVESGGESLRFDGPLASAKLNIGDFSTLKNVGSQFPIGEVFTEAQDLECVNGRVIIYGFTDPTFRLNVPAAPITLVVERGRVVSVVNSTDDFDRVLASITAEEGEVWLRELGFGMNRAFSRERTVSDVGAFERVCGIHLSLGAKHGVYRRPGFKPKEVRHHVDVFAVTKRVLLDETVVFDDGAWSVTARG